MSLQTGAANWLYDLLNEFRALAGTTGGAAGGPDQWLYEILQIVRAGGLGGGSGVVVIDNLESTSTSAALSANMGRSIYLALVAMSGAFDGLAPIDSPAFINAPTAPTCIDGDNSQKLANTQFVQTAIYQAVANLVSTSPAALDTLYELAAALGNDPEFATHVSDALGVRLRFDAAQSLSGAQRIQARDNLGLGTMATAASADYLSLANARFSLNNQTGATYDLVAADVTANGRVLVTCTHAVGVTVNVGTPLSLGASVGDSVTVVQGGVGVVTIAATGAAVLTGTAIFTRQNEAKTMIAISSTTWRLLGAQ